MEEETNGFSLWSCSVRTAPSTGLNMAKWLTWQFFCLGSCCIRTCYSWAIPRLTVLSGMCVLTERCIRESKGKNTSTQGSVTSTMPFNVLVQISEKCIHTHFKKINYKTDFKNKAATIPTRAGERPDAWWIGNIQYLGTPGHSDTEDCGLCRNDKALG